MKRLADLLRDPQFRTDVGNNARDFLQSASNTAASNVTAPVDGLAWLLRRAGVPVPQAPVGGSDWAQNAGLMAEPKNKTSLASLLGEAAGNIAPIVGYAKAPEIAGGLNQLIKNANAPDTLNKGWHGQRGMINIPGRGQIPENQKDVDKLTTKLESLLNKGGVNYRRDSSRVSPSEYFELPSYGPQQGRVTDFEPATKIRISNHPDYYKSDFSVNPSNADYGSSLTFEELINKIDLLHPNSMQKELKLIAKRNGRNLP